jgi:hypothetical protein
MSSYKSIPKKRKRETKTETETETERERERDRLNIADKRLEFCMNDEAFNKLFRSMIWTVYETLYNENNNDDDDDDDDDDDNKKRFLRSNISSSFSCKNTQFLFMTLCYVNNPLIKNQLINDFILNYDSLPKKSVQFEEKSQEIGSYIYKLYMHITPRDNPIVRGTAKFDEITELTNLDYAKSIDTGNYIVCPLCLYSPNRNGSSYVISHYFTFIYDRHNNTNYINSSYGGENVEGNICVPNMTIQIDEEYFISIMNIFSNRIKTDEDIYNASKFVKKYFLPGIHGTIFNKEMSEIQGKRIGIINNYTNFIDNALINIALRTRERETETDTEKEKETKRQRKTKRQTKRQRKTKRPTKRPRDRIGGKKYKKIKTRKIKTRKMKTRKIKTIKRLKKAKKSKSKA